jgi:hypothetical protein
MISAIYPVHFSFGSRAILVIVCAACTAVLPAQTKPNKAERRELKLESGTVADGKPRAEDPQARILSKLREQLEVTDDAEWELIAERITKVGELRRGLASGGGRSAALVNDKNKRSARSGSDRPEQDALRAALTAKLPDAEIKARLARVHEVYMQDEAKLAKAQGELRAVLTVRQEAVAVMAGLLPP